MPSRDPIAVDRTSPPFDRYRNIQWLAPARSGHESHEHVRHQLYAARGKDNPFNVLIKLSSKPGAVYQQDLENEIRTLSTVNRDLPDSPYFPFVYEHGALDDGRVYLIMSLFDEFPLATVVGEERIPHRLVSHLMAVIEVARALTAIHELEIFHVDLNPMNILYRTEKGRPIIRIVDFESSYERSRHGSGAFYSPPTTPGYTAPEVARDVPDARSDLFSLGAVLHTLLSGNLWVGQDELVGQIKADESLDDELRRPLLRAVDPVPENRQPSVAAFQAELEAYLERIWPGRTW